MPASYGTTAKYLLRYLLGASQGLNIDDGFLALASDVDAKLTPYTAGLLAARPVSTGGSPGIAGREYYATDTKELYVDLGTSWLLVAAGSSAWVALTLAGSMSVNGTITPSVRREPGDKAALKGTIAAGASAGTLATITLASGLRPAEQVEVVGSKFVNASSTRVAVTVQIATTGAIVAPVGLVAGDYLSLNGITYPL